MLNRRSLILGGAAAASALCLPALAQGARLSLARFAPSQVGLHWVVEKEGALGTLANLHRRLAAPVALMNAGIYEVGPNGGFQPQGLHIEGGYEYRPINTRAAPNANFYLKPNGVFYIDEIGAHIVRTPDYAPRTKVRLATQSGPLLFDRQGIHPRFLEGSPSRKRRNAVGIDGAGQVVFALADRPINFWDFARAIQDAGCTAALYMDGSISQMWLQGQGAPNDWQQFAGMLSASE